MISLFIKIRFSPVRDFSNSFILGQNIVLLFLFVPCKFGFGMRMGSGYIKHSIPHTYAKWWNIFYKNSDQVLVVSLSIAEAALLTFCGIV